MKVYNGSDIDATQRTILDSCLSSFGLGICLGAIVAFCLGLLP